MTAAVFAVALTAAEAQSTTVTTIPAWDSLGAFGESSDSLVNQTFGQTFTANDSTPVLESFTYYADDRIGSPDSTEFFEFAFYVAAWDGSKATGPLLYESAMVASTNNGGAGGFEFTFNTGGVPLTSGSEYVFFVSSSDVFRRG